MANEQDVTLADIERLTEMLRTNPALAPTLAPALRKLRTSVGRLRAPSQPAGAVQCAGHCISHCISHPPGGDIFTAGQPQPV